MAEQTGQEQSEPEKEGIIWLPREEREDPRDYWTRALAANLLHAVEISETNPAALGPFLKAIARAFGNITGQKEEREGRDGLTGLKTAPLFLKDLEEMTGHVFRQREVGNPEQLCLVLLDVDDLKGLNRRLGHRKADLVIHAVADLISQDRRKEDVVARMGGDEFAILLPDCNAQDAAKISEGIRKSIAQFGTTVSIGVVELGESDSPEGLLEKAQVVRELAKGNPVGRYSIPGEGKNQTVVWQKDMPTQVEQK